MNGKSRNFNQKNYEYYVSEYIRLSEEHGSPLSHAVIYKEPYNLPAARWYIKWCPDDNVKNWSDFKNWCGFYVHRLVTKEKATEFIYRMQSEIERPLMYDDFRGSGCYHVPIDIVNKFWGSLNKMKLDLGLDIVQESMMDRSLSKEEFDQMILAIVNYANKNNIGFVTTKLIDSNPQWLNTGTLRKYAMKYYNESLPNIFKNYHINMGVQGDGIKYYFDDGETTMSQFEYLFSKFLKDFGLQYNKDYFRDVKYKTFASDCDSNINCDYVIYYRGEVIYIEIAGVIDVYKTWYYDDKPISSSKSKETYRLKLKEKENILKSNHLKYFILFPCDLTKENFISILQDGSLDLKHKIESFYKNNIDWNRVMDIGELKYTDNIKWGSRQVDYSYA